MYKILKKVSISAKIPPRSSAVNVLFAVTEEGVISKAEVGADERRRALRRAQGADCSGCSAGTAESTATARIGALLLGAVEAHVNFGPSIPALSLFA